MKVALKKDSVRDIYNKTASYYNIFHNIGTLGLDEKGKVVILELSENMLEQARKKIKKLGMTEKFELKVGDMYAIPYPNETFNTVLSTYSKCP